MSGPVLLHRACAGFHLVAWALFQVAGWVGVSPALAWGFLCALLAGAHLVRAAALARREGVR